MSVLDRERDKNLLFTDMSTNGLGEEWGLTTKIFFYIFTFKREKDAASSETCILQNFVQNCVLLKIICKAESIDMHIQYTCNSYFLVSEKKVTVPNVCFLVGRLFVGHFVSLY